MRKSFLLLVVEDREPMRKKKAESRNTNDIKIRVRCTRDTMNTMVNTTLTPILGEATLHQFESAAKFQNLADIVTTIKKRKCIKIMMSPTSGNVVARGKSECPKSSSMVSTFITQIPTVTVHVLHGEPNPVLGAYHGPLTCERQLHMCTSLYPVQANSSSVLRIIINTKLLVASHWTMWTKKG